MIYIQTKDGIPIDDWAFDAYLGFKLRGNAISFYEDISDVPISKDNLVVGCIDDTIYYLEALGVPRIKSLNIPYSLLDYTGRNLLFCTLKSLKQDVKDGVQEFPMFIKPDGIAKEFPSGVLKKKSSFDFFFGKISDDTNVMVSDVVEFLSEFRGYVIEGELVGLHHYQGDSCIFPDVGIIKKAIESYEYAPAGYSIDFGVTSKGETLLIECNDGWSLGNYGLDNAFYTKLLIKRWNQLIKDV